jgi:SAM-dependent methyltransferase
MFKGLIALQLSRPFGFVGGMVLPLLWNRRNAALNDRTLSRLQLEATDRVLDIGFGGGYLIEKMLHEVTAGRVCGIDASHSMVGRCRANFAPWIREGMLDLQCAMVDSIPYPDDYFMKICSVNSLFFWRDLRAGVREIRRVLAPDGLLVLTFTCKHDMDKRGFPSRTVHTFSEKEMAGILHEQKFADIHMTLEADKHRRFVIVTAKK